MDMQSGTGRGAGWGRVGGAMAALALGAAVQGQAVLYVDDDAPAGGDGTSWNKAYRDLQDALDRCRAERFQGTVDIRIAGGVYTPDRGTLDRDSCFDLGVSPVPTVSSGLAITLLLSLRGGFVGLAGPDHDGRDFEHFPTILSADLRHDDLPNETNRSDNARAVLSGILYGTDLLLDGVTCRGANQDAVYPWPRTASWVLGATIVNSPFPLLRAVDCEFLDNHCSVVEGGSFRFTSGRVEVRRCAFRGNSAPAGRGGAIEVSGFQECEIADSTFSGNTALQGGAMSSLWGRISVSRCVFADNHASLDGGAFWSEDKVFSEFTNSLLVGNSAGRTGGAISMNARYNYEGAAVMIGCTVAGNKAEFGGALYAHSQDLELYNSIIWENAARSAAPAIGFDGFDKVLEIVRCDVQAGANGVYGFWDDLYWDPQNLSVDPQFRDPAGPDDDPETLNDNDYRLAGGSPCIDTGADDASSPYLVDLSGAPRQVDVPERGSSLVDCGAYELQVSGCPADFNLDGFVNGDDFDSFVEAFEQGKPAADADWSGFVNADDFDYFVMRFDQGC